MGVGFTERDSGNISLVSTSLSYLLSIWQSNHIHWQVMTGAGKEPSLPCAILGQAGARHALGQLKMRTKM